MNVYATLDQVKEYLKPESQQQPGRDDNRLRQFCVEASRMFDLFCQNGCSTKRFFYPVVASRVYDHPVETVDVSGVATGLDLLVLRDDILEIDTLTTENGATLIDPSDFALELYPDGRNGPPYNAIRLTGDGTVTAFSYSGTKIRANTVVGTWGWHNDWERAWLDSGDTLAVAISDSDTQLSVADVMGIDDDGVSPRIHNMHTIKIGDEMMFVKSVDPVENTLTVKRGINGATAVAHSQDAVIYTYKPPMEVVAAMKMFTTYVYRRKDSVGKPDDRALSTETGGIVVPQSLPSDIRAVLGPLKRHCL